MQNNQEKLSKNLSVAEKLLLWRKENKSKNDEIKKNGEEEGRGELESIEGTYARGQVNFEDFEEKTEVRKSKGRPKKPNEEKVQVVSFKIYPEIIQKLKNLKIEGGKGLASKVCALLKFYEEKSIIERERILRFQNLLRSFMKSYIAWRKAISLGLKNDDPKKFNEFEEILKERAVKLEEYYGFLCLRLNEYKEILNEEEFKWLEEFLVYKIKYLDKY